MLNDYFLLSHLCTAVVNWDYVSYVHTGTIPLVVQFWLTGGGQLFIDSAHAGSKERWVILAAAELCRTEHQQWLADLPTAVTLRAGLAGWMLPIERPIVRSNKIVLTQLLQLMLCIHDSETSLKKTSGFQEQHLETQLFPASCKIITVNIRASFLSVFVYI